MIELIEELKNNQKINIAKGLENRVNIDYIIDRLEGINDKLINNIEYFDYHNKNLTKEQYYKIDEIKEILKAE